MLRDQGAPTARLAAPPESAGTYFTIRCFILLVIVVHVGRVSTPHSTDCM